MEFIVDWTEEAEAQLDEICEYHLSVASRKTVERLISGIIMSTNILKSFPMVGQREELLSRYAEEFRYLVKGHYKIIYWIGDGKVTISSVFDCRQNPEKLRNMF